MNYLKISKNNLIYYCLAGIFLVPNLLLFFGLAPSLAYGLLILATVYSLVNFNEKKFFYFNLKIALFFSLSILFSSQNHFNLSNIVNHDKQFLSVFLVFIFYSFAINFSKIISKISYKDLENIFINFYFAANFIIIIQCLANYFFPINLLNLNWRHPILFFTEPSHFYLFYLFFSFSFLLIKRFEFKIFIFQIFTFYIYFSFFNSLIFLFGITLILLFYLYYQYKVADKYKLPFFSNNLLIVLFIFFFTSLFVFIFFRNYIFERLMFLSFSTSSDLNLSKLVFLQGIESIYLIFSNFEIFGFGFQNSHNIDYINKYSILIAQSRDGLSSNLSDLGFVAAKIFAEFGIFFGLTLIILYFKNILRLFGRLKDSLFSSHANSKKFLIISPFFLLSPIEFFFKGNGYFTPGILMLLVLILYE
jgi:hypothetical protein